MNILIPMAGAGSRFTNAGYTMPKPLVPVRGKPMISRAVETLGLNGRYIFVIRNNDELRDLLYDMVPSCKIVEIDHQTRGSAETALHASHLIDNGPLLITNCDQIMHWNGKQFQTFLYHVDLDGVIVTYYKNNPRNSYAKVDKMGFVTQIREKEVISDISLNGIHYWRDGNDFISSARTMMQCNDNVNGEFYIAPTYNYLINQGKKIGIYHIPSSQHHAVGIPEDLAKYENFFYGRDA